MTKPLYFYTVWSCILLVGIEADILDCDFFDTVALNRGDKFENGSYVYKNLIVPAHLTGEYDYEVTYDGDRKPVPKHIRGCVCKLRQCIRLCCHSQKLMESDGCSVNYINETLTYDYTVNITRHDGTMMTRHILKDIILQQKLPLPCKSHYHLDKEQSDDDMWTLFENGTLRRHYDEAFLSKQDYCLQPRITNNGTTYSLVPYNCIIEPSLTMGYVKLASVAFLSLTTIIYLWLPRFHSLHGKCSVFYFVCLMLTFLLNVFSVFRVFEDSDHVWCLINGYTGYFLAMATFLWLSVISFDIWRHFGMKYFPKFQTNNRKMFLYYNLIAWSTAGILTLSIYLVDQTVPFTEDNLVPGVGRYSCWIMTDSWSGMLYFYLPIAILIFFNIIMFLLTTRHIYKENKSRDKVLSKFEEKLKTRNRANFGLYLYLFIIMGGSWLLEIVAFICEMENVLEPLVTANDIINCSQGIIIFLVTFCNKELLRDIRDRISRKRNISLELESCNMTQEYPLMQEVK